MRLKQLEVSGFKSFAQRTVLDFPAGITAIVGPNGCGKSNVVDAIRWVLGEQSPKHLRGDSMEDVVFKGNDRVPPLGMTQVSLTFENNLDTRPPPVPDLDVSTLPAHFRNLAEITVTRRYYRSGESEYFINKIACRLKDITELFLGTGVGTKAYAIIEQGRVEQLINAKPEDRRLFIEEAAGTTLYRSRKLAAERKMERTRENLLRVTDVLRELERQIQYLHRLAKKAEQYRSLQEESSTLDLMLSGVKWQRFQEALQRYDAELAAAKQNEERLLGRLAELDAQRIAQQEAVASAEQEHAHWREQVALLDAECQSLAQRAQLLSQQVDERERRVLQLDIEMVSVGKLREDLLTTQQDDVELRDSCAVLMLRSEGGLARKEGQLDAALQRLNQMLEEVDELKSSALGVATRESEAKNLAMGTARRRDEARRRHGLAAEQLEQATQQLAVLERDLARRHLELVILNENLRNTAGLKETGAHRVRLLAEERRQWESEVGEVQTVLVRARSRLQSLRELRQSYEGYSRGVRTILGETRAQSGVLGVVADVLDVPAQYERAVAAALGERLQYIIVRDGSDGVEAVSTLREDDSGRGSFIPLQPRKVDLNGHGAGGLNGSAQRLLDLVKVDERFQQIAETLLGEVILVPDLGAGLALWRRNGVYVTMVTPQGDTIDASGVVTGGSERREEEEIVSRRRILAELADEVAILEGRAAHADAEHARLRHEAESAEAALKALDQHVHALTVQLVTAEKDVERLESERGRWLDRIEVGRFEQGAAKTEEAECDTEQERLSAQLSLLHAERNACGVLLQAGQARLAAARSEVELLRAQITQLKVHLAEARQRYEGTVGALVKLQAQLCETSERHVSVKGERERASQECVELMDAVVAAERSRAEKSIKHTEAENQIQEARTRFDSTVNTLRGIEREVERSRKELEGYREASNRTEIALAEQRVRLGHLVDGVLAKYGVELGSPAAQLSAAEEEEAVSRLESLRERIARIGEVNLGAVEELRELEERAQFLRAQKQDLEGSLDDLEKTIQRLNRASRTRFVETFAAVNERFQEVIPRLFRGGEARLVLTDEHNLLESGVEIVVRPPGKRLETMTLLSGGEKALVAVSLIFSLFLINPTPFCFLDEVDAPLDDANIGRFTELVQEMSQNSQFIVITHNKRTMQAANVLYGVTMQDPGVSKVISVNMH